VQGPEIHPNGGEGGGADGSIGGGGRGGEKVKGGGVRDKSKVSYGGSLRRKPSRRGDEGWCRESLLGVSAQGTFGGESGGTAAGRERNFVRKWGRR